MSEPVGKCLIDRNAMQNDIAVCCHENSSLYGGSCCGVCGLIKKAPVVDAVEVVRCKDCIHYFADMMCEKHTACLPFGIQVNMPADGFCSFGERRTDEKA